MGDYGVAAVIATNLVIRGQITYPTDAWRHAVSQQFLRNQFNQKQVVIGAPILVFVKKALFVEFLLVTIRVLKQTKSMLYQSSSSYARIPTLPIRVIACKVGMIFDSNKFNQLSLGCFLNVFHSVFNMLNLLGLIFTCDCPALPINR